MANYSPVELPDGTILEVEHEGVVPTKAEYELSRRKLELDLSRGAAPTPEASAEIGAGTATGVASIGPRSERQQLESNLEENDRLLRAAREAKAHNVSDLYSAGGGIAGTLGGAAMGAKLGAPFGLPGVATGGALGGIAGSAIGAGSGKLAGYHLPGAPEGAVSGEDQLDQAFKTAEMDLQMNLAFSLAGAGVRTARNVGKFAGFELSSAFGGYRSAAVVNRIREAREFGLRLVPADIHKGYSEMYAAIFGGVPVISGPLRTAAKRRGEEIGAILSGLVGPLESGLNEVVLGKNLLKAAKNANTVRKDWYDRLFAKSRAHFESNPNLRLNNDAIDAARTYVFEQSKKARPVVETSTSRSVRGTATKRTVEQETTRTGSVAKTTDATQELRQGSVEDTTSGVVTDIPPYKLQTSVEDGAETTGLAKTTTEATSQSQVETVRIAQEHYSTTGFDSPGKVEQFIHETLNGPEQLTYDQFRGLSEDIYSAMGSGKATAEQKRALVQMRENLDTMLDTVPDNTARVLLRNDRRIYRQVMEFFENPQSLTFARASKDFATNVKNLERPNIPNLMESELFEALTKDLTPEGVRNLSKLVGPENMKHVGDRWVAQKFDKFIKYREDGDTVVNWQALRSEFGLDVPTSARYAATEQMLKSTQYKMDVTKLGTLVDVLEREVGPKVPNVSKMYIRGAAIGGPQTALRAFFATKALSGASIKALGAAGQLTGPLALVFGLRKHSKFLADPDRLALLSAGLDPSLKAPGVRGAIGRQIVRYLATDMLTDRYPDKKPTKWELDQEEQRLLGVLGDLEQNQSQAPAPPTFNPLSMRPRLPN